MTKDSAMAHQDVYRALARRLDEIPNGFPATESGAELRYLKGLFTLGEAALASVMTTTPESAHAIATRAGVDAQTASCTLETMAHDGLVTMWIQEADNRREVLFGLVPSVLGFYGAELTRMDAELAALLEDYFQASRGLEVPGPAVHRVIPVGEAVQHDVEIHPYEQAVAMIEGAKAWGVRDCICRTQQRLVGQGCDAPMESCLVLAPFEGAFDGSVTDRALAKDEALAILHEAEDAGLVHTVRNDREDHFYICNCCVCCCGLLRRMDDHPAPAIVARSVFRAVVDDAACSGCGVCVDRCQFDALSVSDAGIAEVDVARCVGCGLCAAACPAEALSLTRRPEAEVILPPTDFDAWRSTWQTARQGASRSSIVD